MSKYDYARGLLWNQLNQLKHFQKVKLNWHIKGLSESRKRKIAELKSAIEALRKEGR